MNNATGLLAQLPDLGALNQARDLVQNGLGGVLPQVSGDLGHFVQPITDALGPLSAGNMPDVGGLVAPLNGLREQLVGHLPAGLDQQVGAILPLLKSAEDTINAGVLKPIIDDLRAGKSINDIAQNGLKIAIDQLSGDASGLLGKAVGADKLAEVQTFLSAAGAIGGAPNPSVLANFVAEHLLGVPVALLGGAQGVQAKFVAALDSTGTIVGPALDQAERGLLAQIVAAAERLESLDPSQPANWQPALTALQTAQTTLAAYRQSLAAVPNAVYGALSQLDLTRYKTDLQQALQPLAQASGGLNLGKATSLEGIADEILQPLDEMVARLTAATPMQFSTALSAGLDNLIALFDPVASAVQDNPILHVFDDVKQIVDTIGNAINSVRGVLDGSITALMQTIDAIVGEFNAIKQQVNSAFEQIENALAQIDIDALVQAVGGLLDQVNTLLAAIKLDELKTILDAALGIVDGLVQRLSEVADAAMQGVGSLAETLENLEFGPLAAPVGDAIDALKSTLSAIDPNILPDAVKGVLHEAINAFKEQFDGDLAGYFNENVTDFLSQKFEDAAQAVRDLVASVQAKLQTFSETIGKLDPAKLLEPVTSAFKKLDDAIGGLNGEALLAPVRQVLDEAMTALQTLSPEKLLAPIEQAFEQGVLEPVRRFKPSDLFKPLIKAFQPFEDLINKLDFSEALKETAQKMTGFLHSAHGSVSGSLTLPNVPGLGDMSSQVQPILGLLKPGTSSDEWTAAMDTAFGSYRPSQLLAPIQTALAPVEAALNNASDELLMAVFGQIKAIGGVANAVNAQILSQTISAKLTPAVAALQAHQPAAVSARLGVGFARAQAALNRVDGAALSDAARAQLAAARTALTALNPTTVLAPLSAAFVQLPAALQQVMARALDFSELQRLFGNALNRIGSALPGFVLGELNAAGIRAGLAAFSPSGLVARVDARFDAFIITAQRFVPAIKAAVEGFADKLGNRLADLSPAALFERFDGLFTPIRDALKAISPTAIAAALDQAYEQLLSKLALVHPKVIREPLQALFTSVLGKLSDLKQQLVDRLVEAINTALAHIRETLQALNPQVLVVGLGHFFEVIQQALAKIDLAALLARLVHAFEKLKTDLTQTLQRMTTKFGTVVVAVEALAT